MYPPHSGTELSRFDDDKLLMPYEFKYMMDIHVHLDVLIPKYIRSKVFIMNIELLL